MSDTLCVLPFIHFNISANGQASVCCASQAPLLDDAGKVFNVRAHTLDEIWNSKALKDVRRQMLAGGKPSQCTGCYRNEEQFSGRSHRTEQNSLFLTDDPRDLDMQEAQSGGFPKFLRSTLEQQASGKPAHFDLRFDNLCNLKCIICYGAASSQIEGDPVHMSWTGEAPIGRLPNRFGNSPKWTEAGLLFEELKNISSDVKFIQLAGGEPFLSQLVLRWLDELHASGRSRSVSMMVHTNFIEFDEKLIERLASFKRVHMNLSIDSVGRTYEYVRFPGKWNTIQRNAERLVAELKGRLSNTTVNLNVTISVVSALNACDTFEWAREHGFNATLKNASLPNYIATKFLPEATKWKIEQKLRAYAVAHPEFPRLTTQIEQWVTELSAFDTRDSKHLSAVHNVMRFLNDMDHSRNLNLRATQPELYDDYVSQFGYWLAETRFVNEIFQGPSLGSFDGKAINFDGRRYVVAERIGGAIESAFERPGGYAISGWAADHRANRPAKAIIAVIGNEIVARTSAETRRADIEGGLGTGLNPAGFTIQVFKQARTAAKGEPIRVFALTADGCAVQLAADPVALRAPLAKASFPAHA